MRGEKQVGIRGVVKKYSNHPTGVPGGALGLFQAKRNQEIKSALGRGGKKRKGGGLASGVKGLSCSGRTSQPLWSGRKAAGPSGLPDASREAGGSAALSLEGKALGSPSSPRAGAFAKNRTRCGM